MMHGHMDIKNILSVLGAGRKVCRSYKVVEVVDSLNSYSCVIYDSAATTTRPFVIRNIN